MPCDDNVATKLLRVFVSSPGDVADERALVPEILARINTTDGEARGYRLEDFRYERDVPPKIGPSAQDVVDAATPPYHIYLGIMAARFGTPTGTHGSGTEKEYRDAYERWRKTKKTHIFFYFRDDVVPGRDADALAQYARVCELRRELDQNGLTGNFNCTRGARTGFCEQVEQHLRMVALRLLQEHVSRDGGIADNRDAEPVTIVPAAPACVGRDEIIEKLVGAVLAERLAPVGVLGGPGNGKSTVTLAALNDVRIAQLFGARRYFVRGETAANAEALIGAIAQAMMLQPTPNLKSAVFGKLQRAPSLLVVDNSETPLEGDRTGTETLLAELVSLPGVALVMSLRGAELPPNLVWGTRLNVKPLPLADARLAFLAVSGEHFENDPNLDALCAAADGVPLALTLLACLAQGEPDLSGVWQRWQRGSTEILKRGSGGDRLTNLGLSLELSISGPRMTAVARRLLSGLALLPDGFARLDLEPAFGDEASEASSTLRKVGLAYDDSAGRLRLLAPVRDHTRLRHPPDEQTAARIVQHYLCLAGELGNQAGHEGGGAAIARLAPEIANVEAAILRMLQAPNPAPAIDAALATGRLARFSGLGSSLPLKAAQAEASRRGSVLSEADCIKSLGDIALARSDHEVARKSYQDALILYRQNHNTVGEANCIQRLGDVAFGRSDHDAASQCYGDALTLYRRVGDNLGEASCIERLGDIALERRDSDTARKSYEDALALYRKVGALLGEANCIESLGDIAFTGADHDTARKCYEDALPLYRRIGVVLGEANCIQSLGNLAFERSDHDDAHNCYEEALALYRRVGNVLGEANCIQGLGRIASDQPNEEAARQRYREALQLYSRIPEPYSMGRTHRRLARLENDAKEKLGHVRKARELWLSIKRTDLVEELRREFGELVD